MTVEEFSNEFEVLIQSYSKQLQGGETDDLSFTEYEKSTFLTKAQEELVIEFYNGNNPNRDSFEKTEEIRRYLSSLVISFEGKRTASPIQGLTATSQFFSMPADLWFITYESATLKSTDKCINGLIVPVIPIRQDEFNRLKNNPFRGASKSRVLRLDVSGNLVELISKYDIDKYLIRYLAKPNPIIIEDLPQSLSINNINKKTECSLNPALHRLILDRAVRMALISKSVNINNLNEQ